MGEYRWIGQAKSDELIACQVRGLRNQRVLGGLWSEKVKRWLDFRSADARVVPIKKQKTIYIKWLQRKLYYIRTLFADGVREAFRGSKWLIFHCLNFSRSFRLCKKTFPIPVAILDNSASLFCKMIEFLLDYIFVETFKIKIYFDLGVV